MSQSEIDEYNKKFAEIEYRFTGGLEKQKIYKIGISILFAAGLIAAINFLVDDKKAVKKYKSDIVHSEKNSKLIEYDMKNEDKFIKSFKETNKNIVEKLKKYKKYDKKYLNFFYCCKGVDEKILQAALDRTRELVETNPKDLNQNIILGRGANSTVFEWKCEIDGKTYALKINRTFYENHDNHDVYPIKFSEIYINDCLNMRGNNVKVYGGYNSDEIGFILMEKLDIIPWENGSFTQKNMLYFLNIIGILKLANIYVPDLHRQNLFKLSDDRIVISDFGHVDVYTTRRSIFPFEDFYIYFIKVVGRARINEIDATVIKYYLNIDDSQERLQMLNETRKKISNSPLLLNKFKDANLESEVTIGTEEKFLNILKKERIIALNDKEIWAEYINSSNEEIKLECLNNIRSILLSRLLLKPSNKFYEENKDMLNNPVTNDTMHTFTEKIKNFYGTVQGTYRREYDFKDTKYPGKYEFYAFIEYSLNSSDTDANLKLMYEYIKLNPDYQQQFDKTKSPPMFFGGGYFVSIVIIVLIILIIMLIVHIKNRFFLKPIR